MFNKLQVNTPIKTMLTGSLILLMFFAFSLMVQADTNIRGEEWQEYTREEKEIYLKGFIESFNEMRIKMMLDSLAEADRDEVAKNLRSSGELIVYDEAEITRISHEVDEFYDEFEIEREVSDVLLNEVKILQQGGD